MLCALGNTEQKEAFLWNSFGAFSGVPKCSKRSLGLFLFQAAHGPLNTPTKDMFTVEQLEVLGTISNEDVLRQKFAKIVYFLDITVRRWALQKHPNTLRLLSVFRRNILTSYGFRKTPCTQESCTTIS